MKTSLVLCLSLLSLLATAGPELTLSIFTPHGYELSCKMQNRPSSKICFAGKSVSQTEFQADIVGGVHERECPNFRAYLPHVENILAHQGFNELTIKDSLAQFEVFGYGSQLISSRLFLALFKISKHKSFLHYAGFIEGNDEEAQRADRELQQLSQYSVADFIRRYLPDVTVERLEIACPEGNFQMSFLDFCRMLHENGARRGNPTARKLVEEIIFAAEENFAATAWPDIPMVKSIKEM
ncbi:MAG: hypothetical protein SGCHY_000551 [Lobulomycetales sp.]